MAERGIIFSGPMVLAIADGRKTQTRRLRTGRKPHQVGDILWVKETFWIGHDCDNFENQPPFDCGVTLTDPGSPVQYSCTPNNPDRPGEPGEWFGPDDIFTERSWLPWGAGWLVPHFWSKRPAIHMPRWASRYTLEVVEHRVQRLHDISHTDIRAEGVDCPTHDFSSGFCVSECPSLRYNFASLWDAINGDRRVKEFAQLGEPGYPGHRTRRDESASWDANPKVDAYTFKVIKRPS